jgi:hypothetical protein
MSTIIRDSGKPYGAIADAAQNMWSVVSNCALQPGGRYSTDNQCFSILSSPATMQAASSTNDGTVFLFAANIMTQTFGTLTGDWIWQGLDGASTQFTIFFSHSDGSIKVYSGTTGGTLQQSWASGFSQQQWNGWNIKVVVHNTAGEVHIRKNGATSDTFSITNINTRGGSSNNYVNQHIVGVGSGAGMSYGWKWQDLWLYNSTVGNGPSDFLPNDVRTFWMSPNGPSQTQFTAVGSPVQTYGTASGGNAYSANTMYAQLIGLANFNGTLASLKLNFGANMTGSCALSIYDNTGAAGQPGNLIGTTNTVVNPATGSVTFTFSSPPTVSTAVQYYIVVEGNAGMNLMGPGASASTYTVAQTFGSWPTPAPTMTSSSISQFFYQLVYTTANYTNVSDLAQDGAVSTVQSSTIGQTDLYTLTPLPVTPTAILGVQVRGFMYKSDSNARSGSLAVKSSAVEVDSAATPLPTTPGNIVAQQDTDPNTAAVWTPGGLNAALLGPKCAA